MHQTLKPCLVLKESVVKANILKMKSLCDQHQMDFRPHFKTHQSVEIGNWFKQLGIQKCTVSSVGMARYFTQSGWKDITIAIPFNIKEVGLLEDFDDDTQINVCIDHPDTVKALSKSNRALKVFVEIDGGYQRSGIPHHHLATIDQVINEISYAKNLVFAGFLSHTGNNYHVNNVKEGAALFEENRIRMLELNQTYIDDYPNIIVSMGDTPSSFFSNDFSGIDEWRPGNFVFYDLMQLFLKSCDETDIALSVNCPVIGIYPHRNELVIYGGGVHLSKESILHNGENVFGWVKIQDSKLMDGYPLISLSQEHGIIKADSEFVGKTKIGDILEIIPVHSCMTADLYPSYYLSDSKFISKYRTQ